MHMKNFLLLLLAVIVHGPLDSTCIVFDVSSRIIDNTKLMVNYTLGDKDPPKWVVLVNADHFSVLFPIQMYGESQSNNGTLTFYRLNFDLNITLQGFGWNNSDIVPLGDATNPFLLPALVQVNNTVTAFPETTSTSSRASSSSTSSSTPRSQTLSDNTKTHTNIIIGVAIGSFAFALILVVASLLWLRRRRQRKFAPSDFIRNKMIRELDS
ncbi:hypothetical protein GGU10DRAFT_352615 [Lentinula aff. detonsa]|uniref:Mid2 domain-containing protein n=1 Tax=Lentinula aff. detonsa TaxID=2804958 RepID=A0AA38KGN1_9AGAR|nr:hypothetical protein GGU10DRAFT_352615 [Lentinula aff. detonsa]